MQKKVPVSLILALTLLLVPAIGRAQTKVIAGGGSAYQGKTLSMDFKDAEVADILRFLAEFSGMNLVLHSSVQGKITLKLTDVPWDQALDIVLKNNGLAADVQGGVIRVATTAVLTQEEVASRRLEEERTLSQPTVTITRALSYAKVKDVAPIIEKFLTKRGSIITDARTNTIIIEDVPESRSRIEGALDAADR